MTRPLRGAVRNGGYHVFGRGLERRAIFGAESERRETAGDREHFLELLAEVHERYRLRIHACALSLYVHLNPVRITDLGLDRNGRGMEGKGWRRPSREEVDARLRRLREYRWSSYRAYAGYTPAPEWLEMGEPKRSS